MKVVRQARLELSGGSTPDQLSPPPPSSNDIAPCLTAHQMIQLCPPQIDLPVQLHGIGVQLQQLC